PPRTPPPSLFPYTTPFRSDQSRIELVQPGRTGAEPFRRARAEILDVDVRLPDQPLEDVAVLRLLEIQGDAALVAIVGLEVRRVRDRKSTRLNSSHVKSSYA